MAGEDGQITAIGRGFRLSFQRTDGRKVGILSADELTRNVDGLTRVVRRWNGDETAGGCIRIPPLTGDPAAVTPDPGDDIQQRGCSSAAVFVRNLGDATLQRSQHRG